jgi:prevent-host-death family protein
MQRIQEYVPVTKAKNILLDLVRKINDTDDIVAITKNGVPQVVLLSMERFEGLLETVDILSDEQAMLSIKKSIREAERGKWLDMDEVFER